jgi:hypothetical protein
MAKAMAFPPKERENNIVAGLSEGNNDVDGQFIWRRQFCRHLPLEGTRAAVRADAVEGKPPGL